MRTIYDALDESDLSIFDTPVYVYGPPGPMKTFIDRLRPYMTNNKFMDK